MGDEDKEMNAPVRKLPQRRHAAVRRLHLSNVKGLKSS